MGIIKGILVFTEILISFLLVAVILIQKTKDEGLGLAFGGMMGETLFGSRAGNVLTRITIILAVVFLLNTALLGLVYSRGGESSLVDRAVPASAPASYPGAGPAPAAPAPPAGAPPATVPEAPATPSVPDEGATAPPSETPAAPAPAVPAEAASGT
jgi:preprotein translocase subunit SecG